MASYPSELAQDAAYQSYTSHLTELWSLPRPAQWLNTNNNKCLYTSRILKGIYICNLFPSQIIL